MNIGRFIDVYYQDNNEGTYNVNELGVHFTGTTDNELSAAVQERLDGLCDMLETSSLPMVDLTLKVVMLGEGSVRARVAYVVISVLTDLLEREWSRTTIPVVITDMELWQIAQLAAKSYAEALEEAYY